MRANPSLRRDLVAALTLLLIAGICVAGVAVLLWLPVGAPTRDIALFLVAVLVIDVTVFVIVGDYLLRQLVLRPVVSIQQGAEAIARDDYSRRVKLVGAREFQRLAANVNELGVKLIQNQKRLSDNIRSLNEVNRALTEARDELVRAEKLASAGQLAAGIAHEIGNPLGAILGYLEVADRRPGIGPEIVQDLRREARRIDRIVRGLLDYARPRQPAPRSIDVNEVVSGALELVESQGHFKDIELIHSLGQHIPTVRADAHQLEQTMVNLLLNAAQAVNGQERRWIRVSTDSVSWEATLPPARRRDDPPGIDYSHLRRLHARREGLTPPPVTKGSRVVRISVRDSGPGIPTEIGDRIFDPFFSTKETGQGTGLGLAVSARLIEGMGGAILVENPEGGGACFAVYLPAAKSEVETGESARS